MAETYVALLRGINVGRAKRVAMAELRALVEALGHTRVRTLLNSGNVVFEGRRAPPARVARAIERAVAARTAVSSRVTVLTAADLEAVVRENTLAGISDDPSRLMVAVMAEPGAGAMIAPLLRQRWAPESLALGSRAAYLWCPSGIIESPLASAVERALGDGVTTRNWATIGRIRALVTADLASD